MSGAPDKMKLQFLLILWLVLSIIGCTPYLPQCFLKLIDYEKTYAFDFSKEELKNKIVEAYTYDKSLLVKNLGITLIENEKVDSEYRKSLDIWLDKGNWNEVKSEIRINTNDTLYLLIGKHHSMKQIKLTAIIHGEKNNSSLTIKNIEYEQRKACTLDKDYYKIRISNKIESKLIEKLK